MGAGASAAGEQLASASPEDLKKAFEALPSDARDKVKQALNGAGAAAAPDAAASKDSKAIEIYGLPGSMNCMGPVLLAMHKQLGSMVPTTVGEDGTKKPEYLSMNPFGQIPAMKDLSSGTTTAESSAMLRYIASKHAPDLYPAADPQRMGYIDWAMDNFACGLYKDGVATLYPLFGYAEPPADREAAGKTASEHLKEFADFFLREKFIGGSSLSIADFKVAPFFFCFAHPVVKAQSHVECPERVLRFVADFKEACGSCCDMLNAAGGWGLKELLDKANGSAAELLTPGEAPAFLERPASKTSGQVKVFAVAPSMNAMAPTLLALDAKCGEMVPTMPPADTMKPEFLEMNPFHSIPTIKDGDYCLGESTAILRYLAQAYAKQLYPSDDYAARAHIDWAIDNFSSNLYKEAVTTLYPCLGFMPFPENVKETGAALGAKLQKYCDVFLKGKFVGGDSLSIADYKIAPFFFSWEHPIVKDKTGLEVPERIVQYNKDFAAACENAKMLSEAGGFAVKEMLDKAQQS